MADQDIPSRASNMEKAEGDRDDARNQEQLVERHPRHEDPTRLDEERTSDNSTVDNGGVGHGEQSNPVMPSDDSSLGVKI
jgi:hypothetical protein